jgi:chemotaxis protein CheD
VIAKGQKITTINIGDAYAGNQGEVIYTLLGSCVAVCLYDPKMHIGGMNHVYLPGDTKRSLPFENKYSENTMGQLMKCVFKLNSNRRNLVAKLFGGAHIISQITDELSVGSKIIDYVKGFLEKERIPVVAWDLGGSMARKVYFCIDTGDVYVKKIQSSRES